MVAIDSRRSVESAEYRVTVHARGLLFIAGTHQRRPLNSPACSRVTCLSTPPADFYAAGVIARAICACSFHPTPTQTTRQTFRSMQHLSIAVVPGRRACADGPSRLYRRAALQSIASSGASLLRPASSVTRGLVLPGSRPAWQQAPPHASHVPSLPSIAQLQPSRYRMQLLLTASVAVRQAYASDKRRK